MPSKRPNLAEPKIASHRTLTAPHFRCQVEQTQTSQLSEESSFSLSPTHFWKAAAAEKLNLLFDVNRQIVFQRLSNTLCKQPPF